MQITFFSFCMALLWSNLIILFLYLLRKNYIFNNFFSVKAIILIYMACFLRMILPLELPYNHVIVSNIVTEFYTIIRLKPFTFIGLTIDIKTILIIVWLTGIVVSLSTLIWAYHKLFVKIQYGCITPDPTLMCIFEQIIPDHKKRRYHFYLHKSIQSPISCGIFNKYILLTDREFEDWEAYCIIKHEYTHLANHDTIVQLLLNVLCCIYWWNPFTHVLFDSLRRITEIRCDLTSTAKMDKEEKAEYLEAMLHSYEVDGSVEYDFDLEAIGTRYFYEKDEEILNERFDFILEYRNTKWKKFVNVILIGLFVATYVFSYMFIVQSYYEIPVDDAKPPYNAYQYNSNDNNIIKFQDGSYWLITSDNTINEISENIAHQLQSNGIQIINN